MKQVDRILSEGGLWGWLVKPYVFNFLKPDVWSMIEESRLIASVIANRWLMAQAAYTMVPFRYRNHPPHIYPKVKKFMDEFRCAEGRNVKVGVVGFCWGGYHVTHLAHGDLAANGRTIIDAAFTAHPSGLTIPADIKGVVLPYSVSIGDVDFAIPMKEVEMMKHILKENQDLDSEVVVIPNAKHGFAVRADCDDQTAMAMAEQAEDQAVKWFEKHLSGGAVAARKG